MKKYGELLGKWYGKWVFSDSEYLLDIKNISAKTLSVSAFCGFKKKGFILFSQKYRLRKMNGFLSLYDTNRVEMTFNGVYVSLSFIVSFGVGLKGTMRNSREDLVDTIYMTRRK